MIEGVLTQALDPSQTITPDQLKDLMEMFVTDLHLRKVLGEPWMEIVPICTRGIELAAQIKAEGRLSRTPDLPEGVVKTIDAAIELSLQEIRSLREKLMKHLDLLKQCPPEGAQIH